MTLLLIRHVETDWNREPARCQGWAEIGINETGRVQARAAARTLAGSGIELIVTSHLRRARETAELMREELGGELPLVVDPRLAETHRGEWESRLFVEIMLDDAQSWRRYREHPQTFRFPGGESLADQQRRVLAALRDAARDGRQALLVTHAGSLRAARCFLDGRGLAAFHEMGAGNGGANEVPSEGLAARITAFLEGSR
ncbi:MAG: histidine phosphatase family protein [Actinobacteria bacterium]|nr:histidine phosphatase family protein [Actinomycetota bacterium]